MQIIQASFAAVRTESLPLARSISQGALRAVTDPVELIITKIEFAGSHDNFI